MKFKKIVRGIHLWLGLSSGLILSAIGISGSLYVFEPELSALLEHELYTLQGDQMRFENDIEIARYVEDHLQGSIESIQWPKRGRETYVLKVFDDDRWYYMDQSTGKITLKGEALGNSIFGTILDIHTTLTLDETGRVVTGVASLIFALLMLTTGLYLWYPNKKGRVKSSFKIKRRTGPKRFNYDLHNVTGFYFFIPLFLIGLTGAAFYFNDEAHWLLNSVTGSPTLHESIWEVKSNPGHQKGLKFMNVEDALLEMNKYYPQLYKRNLWMTSDADGSLSFAYQEKIDLYAGPDTRIFLRADPYNGNILSTYDPNRMAFGSAIIAKWHLPVHFGEFGGLPTRILWFILGFVPALLSYTGLKIWIGKKTKINPRIKMA